MNSPTNNLLLDQFAYFLRFIYRLIFKKRAKIKGAVLPKVSVEDLAKKQQQIERRLNNHLRYYDPIRNAFSIYILPPGSNNLVHLVDSNVFGDFLDENKYLVRFRKGHTTKCKGGAVYFAIKSPLISHVLVVGNALEDWWLLPSSSKNVIEYMEILRKI